MPLAFCGCDTDCCETASTMHFGLVCKQFNDCAHVAGIFGAVAIALVIVYPNLTATIDQIIEAIIGLVALACIILYGRREMREATIAYRIAPIKFQSKADAQTKMMERWERLYYCRRCDRVFDPSSGKSAPSEHRLELLG